MGRLSAFRIAVALSGALIVSACGLSAKGEVYPVALREVRETLRNTDPPMDVFGSTAVTSRTMQLSDGTIIWMVLDERERELMRFSAQTTAEGPDQTRVVVSVRPPEGSRKEAVAKRMVDYPSIVDLYSTAMTEQIDSTLEHRSFDLTRIAAATAGAVVTTMPEIRASMQKADAEYKRLGAENIARAYDKEGQGGWDAVASENKNDGSN